MFDPEQGIAPLSPSDAAMVQQKQQSKMHFETEPDELEWLQAENGRERLRSLLEQWIKRNGWSLAVVSRLAELSLLANSKTPVPDWCAGMQLQSGALVNHRGHVWQAAEDAPLSEPLDGDPLWLDRGLSSRLHPSGLNLYLRNRKTSTVSFLLEMGRLNEWIDSVQEGKAAQPKDSRLCELVMGATVIRDNEGPYGAEDFLSIAAGRLQPPPWFDQVSAAHTDGVVSGRQLRAAVASAGLDIVDDWLRIAELYPTKDRNRLERLKQVLKGDALWEPGEAANEQVAVVLLLQRLKQEAAEQTAITGDEA